MTKEMLKDKVDTIAEAFRQQLNVQKVFRSEKNVLRKAEDENGCKYEYTVPICIFTNNILVAEIYVADSTSWTSTATVAYQNALFADTRPLYLFIHCEDKWKGISLYEKSDEPSNPSYYTNNYGRIYIDSTEMQLETSVDVDKMFWNANYKEMIGMITEQNCDRGITDALLQGFQEQINDWMRSINSCDALGIDVEKFMSEIKTINNPFEIGKLDFHLKRELEDRFFKAILGELTDTEFSRFTSLNSLAALLQNCSQRMWSIASMNDKTECYYADDYIKQNQDGDELDENERYEDVEAYFNNYITSLSYCKENNLTMWRLYGDDSKGVCLFFEADGMNNSDFILAPVSYSEEQAGKVKHTKLDLIKFLLEGQLEVCHRRFVLKRWLIWKHLFKSYHYAVEQEVRLLYSPKVVPVRNQWTIANNRVLSPYIDFSFEKDPKYPLHLSKIVLGPNCPEKETNKALIKALLRDMGMKCEVEVINDIYYMPVQK